MAQLKVRSQRHVRATPRVPVYLPRMLQQTKCLCESVRVCAHVCLCRSLQARFEASGKESSSRTRRTAEFANASTATTDSCAPRFKSLFHVFGKGTPRSAALSALTQTSDSWITPSTAMAQLKVRSLRHVRATPRVPVYLTCFQHCNQTYQAICLCVCVLLDAACNRASSLRAKTALAERAELRRERKRPPPAPPCADSSRSSTPLASARLVEQHHDTTAAPRKPRGHSRLSDAK